MTANRRSFELYAYVKSGLIRDVVVSAWGALFALAAAPVPLALFMIAAAQGLLFVAFVVIVALRDRTVIDSQLAVFPMFLLLSLPPLYIAWASPWTTSDMVLLMYSCLALAVVWLAQFVGGAIVRRSPIPPLTR